MDQPSSSNFTPQEMDSLLKYFVGNTYRYRENVIIPRTVGPVEIKSIDQKRIEAVYESCVTKALISTVLGKLIGYDLIDQFSHFYSLFSILLQAMVWGRVSGYLVPV